MTGGSSPENGAGEGWMKQFEEVGREEILQVLSRVGFCEHCQDVLESRVHDLINDKRIMVYSPGDASEVLTEVQSADVSSLRSPERQDSTPICSIQTPESGYLARLKGNSSANNSSPVSVNSHPNLVDDHLGSEILLNDGLGGVSSSTVNNGLSEEQKERIRFSQVGRKKNFVHVERINGKAMNVLEGLELHTDVFNDTEQKKIVECVHDLQHMGQKGQLRERTYSEPKKWMRGKGRVTIQFGSCYNYAVDKDGNLPGIIRDEQVDPLPPIFKQMIKRMVRWHVLPPKCVPDSCIVNIYDEGDCIPPHIDHHDFLRPFCTVSFLTECNIIFGSNLKIVGPGEFSGPVSIPLPVGSVLILNGNGADIPKHCVPGVPAKRISITFRKMDDSKLPYEFSPDPEMLGIKPLAISPLRKSPYQKSQHQNPCDYSSITKSSDHQNGKPSEKKSEGGGTTSPAGFSIKKDEFPPLGSSKSLSRASKVNGVRSKQ